MSESFQPENSGATPDKPSDSEPVPLDKTRDALGRLPSESLERIYRYAGKFRYLESKTIYSPKDLVQEAFARLLNGSRRWNPKYDLETVIIGTVRSLASQIGESTSESGQKGSDQATAPSPPDGEMESSGDEANEPAFLGSEMESPEEDESAREKPRHATKRQEPADFLTPDRLILREKVAAERRLTILKCVENDHLLTKVVLYRLEHPDAKRSVVAADLGIPLKDYDNLQKRFDRKFAKLGDPKEILQVFAEDPEPQPNPRTLNFPKEV